MQGTIKNLNGKGFGFITVEGQEKDLFFHAKDVRGVTFNDLKKGMTVSFNTEESDRGPKATDIEIAEEGAGRMPRGKAADDDMDMSA